MRKSAARTLVFARPAKKVTPFVFVSRFDDSKVCSTSCGARPSTARQQDSVSGRGNQARPIAHICCFPRRGIARLRLRRSRSRGEISLRPSLDHACEVGRLLPSLRVFRHRSAGSLSMVRCSNSDAPPLPARHRVSTISQGPVMWTGLVAVFDRPLVTLAAFLKCRRLGGTPLASSFLPAPCRQQGP